MPLNFEQFGFASALETLCGQAYGAEQYQKIGTYTYPAIVPFVSNNLSLEWWSYEILVLLSGILPNPKLETSFLTIWYVSTLIASPPSY
ncbi:hypothetical protein CUMW_077640 [Citrus unshiu]|nr:hypothetical protein CUMW_077640 [Citrus unshiu]